MRKLLIYFSLFALTILCATGCSFNNNNSNENSSSEVSNIDSNSKNQNTPSSSSQSNKSNNLDNEITNWFYIPNTTHTTPDINPDLNYELSTYDAIYNLDSNRKSKTLYLTFDEGYENGYTTKILDILKEKNVQAVFFVTSSYIDKNPDLIKRMVLEGHIVGNHSATHPSMPTLTSNENEFNEEISDVETKYEKLIGAKMNKLFRPPMGCYSEKSLSMTKDLGYKTVFWSFAYDDWDPEKQPELKYAKKKILDNLHDGSILLLHAVSKTNTEILGDVIDSAKDLGYDFQLIK
ncbi:MULTISPECIES: delta-lactam-biosynthetic de-N-acetylase [unclassified Romboutsia]|uniref:delta-lactam-biosynthetic de-N-acetylase n=1 Tax=unclassified Romboutsia TaxID=2626894 RepID=UPI0008207937|nr:MULTISPECIES: delta-lactam-biosynthetic de-N-acetylase [unclassified Romboutsia]SCI04951.1 Probable polysaccharide deacetylase pdaA precursor [uncultured Clostridium sp.]